MTLQRIESPVTVNSRYPKREIRKLFNTPTGQFVRNSGKGEDLGYFGTLSKNYV